MHMTYVAVLLIFIRIYYKTFPKNKYIKLILNLSIGLTIGFCKKENVYLNLYYFRTFSLQTKDI